MKLHPQRTRHGCAEVPEFERLNYFYGQLLSAADFRTEQSYLREKLKLHNRCLHGYGVICGLEVEPIPVDDCCPSPCRERDDQLEAEARGIEAEIQAVQEQLTRSSLPNARWTELQRQLETLTAGREAIYRRREHGGSAAPSRETPQTTLKVLVHCGLALDCLGNELVLRQPVEVPLWTALSPKDQTRCQERPESDLWLSLCYCAEPTHPSRPVLPDSCGTLSDCHYGKYRDSVRFRVSLEPPADDERCETCCAPCEDECVVLAKITWDGFSAITAAQIDNGVRRPLSRYQPAVISGVSWLHGQTYSSSEAKAVLGTAVDSGMRTDGIEIAFSRGVFAETLTSGVVDLWRVQGGRGLRGVLSHIEGDYVGKPASGLVTSVRFRDESGESLNSGDRIIVVVRGDFVLDACCRPLDGNHVGGRVPQLEAYRESERTSRKDAQPASDRDERSGRAQRALRQCADAAPCLTPPGGGPWTSGTGTVGGTFESWFYIE